MLSGLETCARSLDEHPKTSTRIWTTTLTPETGAQSPGWGEGGGGPIRAQQPANALLPLHSHGRWDPPSPHWGGPRRRSSAHLEAGLTGACCLRSTHRGWQETGYPIPSQWPDGRRHSAGVGGGGQMMAEGMMACCGGGNQNPMA